jgi:hypothetical protein
VECGCTFEGQDFDMDLPTFEDYITLEHVTQCFDALGEYSSEKKA